MRVTTMMLVGIVPVGVEVLLLGVVLLWLSALRVKAGPRDGSVVGCVVERGRWVDKTVGYGWTWKKQLEVEEVTSRPLRAMLEGAIASDPVRVLRRVGTVITLLVVFVWPVFATLAVVYAVTGAVDRHIVLLFVVLDKVFFVGLMVGLLLSVRVRYRFWQHLASSVEGYGVEARGHRAWIVRGAAAATEKTPLL